MMIHRRLLCFLSIITALAVFGPTLRHSTADTFRPVVRGRRGVVAGGQPLSVEAGMRILQHGGNAVDAGVATVLAASVIEFSHFSFGGEVPILIKLKGRDVAVIEGMGTAPAKANREFFVNRARERGAGTTASAPDSSATLRAGNANEDMPTMAGAKSGLIPSTGPLAATVPAVLDACVTALDQFGTKSLAEVMQPAIELADGFPIDELRVNYINTRAPTFSQWADAKRVFLPNGSAPKVGDVFAQADLARTLRSIVAVEKRSAGRGRHASLMAARDYFYKGPLAKRIGDYMQTHGGLLATADMAGWHAKVGAPSKGEYRGYEVYKTGFWAQGPMMIEVLNLLEGYDLKKMGQNSPEYIHTVTEALKLGFSDRDRFYGDPDFVKVPGAQLLSKDYAAMRRSLIDAQNASLLQRPGDPANMKPLLANAKQISYNAEPIPEIDKANDTTCVNVIDKDGNMFSATPSGAWLPAVVAGDTGVLMGQRLQSALTDPNSPNVVAPGKRPRITLTPTLVLKNGQPFMILSTPGGDNQDQALVQVLLNVIEFGMNPQEAVEAPRFDTQHYISSFDNHEFLAGVLNIESRIPADVISQLNKRGHKLKIQSDWGTGSSPTVIMYDARSGVISGGADPRRGRYAVAW
ncbi:MAG: gamma-glutamyltranspeptidase / glutathione hydrolase [Blastocatellia bacterium]|jgi:gamma-glutamyltranspeptidase/glutathione hydrolase|nr:gamma-glutamyltranspeptidase / glutathione hydrolase [Blastocatellia bacterium]